MSFALHPEFSSFIDRASEELRESLKDVTALAREDRGGLLSHPDHPIAAKLTDKDIISIPQWWQVDVAGNKIAYFFPKDDIVLGLVEEGAKEAARLIERIWSRRELVNQISRSTIESIFMDWIGATVRGESTSALSKKIEDGVSELIRPVSVWVPLESIYIEGQFRFADAVLEPLTLVALDQALPNPTDPSHREALEKYRERLVDECVGKPVMRFELIAEPVRAQELAWERAIDYMTLLQFFSAPAMILPLCSHAAPTGARPYKIRRAIAFGPSVFQEKKEIAEAPWQFDITSEFQKQIEQMGALVLSSLAIEALCDYEERALDALLVYGRACYQLDPADKLLQVMTAVEMFGLRDASEPISAALADRMAFAISSDPEGRQEIVRNFRETYAIRSRRTHHGHSISDSDTIQKFLGNAWSFFLTVLRGVGRFKSRTDFLDDLDRKKYGH